LIGDKIYEQYGDIADLPESIVKRLQHYFLTYKNLPSEPHVCEIAYMYGRETVARSHQRINQRLCGADE
jgi:inorganic pyrophosphatase